ncbi:MFS transporter [Planomicrobium okeanokoites]|uniref:MFS transporter n=1 Tax=Planomicrobium okeanokoites TaxID=244 RepID=A0ABV7KSK2_PLAOK|nr:MFS transporter [Planomicrobium okeanokoites]TAA70270.1 MFS transporter [Planomicrobium okeanokoites]
MKKYSKSFRSLWDGEVVSEFGGAAGAIVNGLLLYELTGSREWMGILWLVYFIPSLVLQGISSPFLNHVAKEKMLKNIQLIRAGAYLLPLTGFIIGTNTGTIIGLVILQCTLGLLQPIFASLSFSLLPEICAEEELADANGLLDATLRLMSFLAPGVTALLLIVLPMHWLHGLSALLFFISFLALSRLPQTGKQKVAAWTRKFWWSEMKEGYRSFFSYPKLLRLTLLSSTVQFAVGATLVLSIPFIRGVLEGEAWEYGVFKGAFPIGYVFGMLLLTKLPKSPQTMYIGLIGGGLSFMLLFFVHSVPFAWLCELMGGILFPLFNAQSAAIFQREAPRDRLAQLSAVRLLFLRATMPLGILFASLPFLSLNIRFVYVGIGAVIVFPGLYYLIISLQEKNGLIRYRQKV